MSINMRGLLVLLFLIGLTSCKTKFSPQENDTVLFVLFEKTENTGKRSDLSHPRMTRQTYWFNINKYTYFSDQIVLKYFNYKDYDELERNNPVPVFHVNKRFLKNNKSRILTLEKMKEMGYQETLVLIKKAKHVFLIDEKESKEKLLSIKEVFLFEIGEE